MMNRIYTLAGISFIVIIVLNLLVVMLSLAAISSPTVELSDDVITHGCQYSIVFTVNEELQQDVDCVCIHFPLGTDITPITDAADSDVMIAATSGYRVSGFDYTNATSREYDSPPGFRTLPLALSIKVPKPIGINDTHNA